MPKYKDKSRFFPSQDKRFDELLKPGQEVHVDGIYICMTCGFETYVESGTALPSAPTCAEHADNLDWYSEGAAIWRLLAALVNRQR